MSQFQHPKTVVQRKYGGLPVKNLVCHYVQVQTRLAPRLTQKIRTLRKIKVVFLNVWKGKAVFVVFWLKGWVRLGVVYFKSRQKHRTTVKPHISYESILNPVCLKITIWFDSVIKACEIYRFFCLFWHHISSFSSRTSTRFALFQPFHHFSLFFLNKNLRSKQTGAIAGGGVAIRSP